MPDCFLVDTSSSLGEQPFPISPFDQSINIATHDVAIPTSPRGCTAGHTSWPPATNAVGASALPRRLELAVVLRMLTHPLSAQLTSLCLANRRVLNDGAAAISQVAGRLPALSTLDLSHSGLTCGGAPSAIASLLSTSRSLTALRLKGNALESAGVTQLVQGLRRNSHARLQLLDLSETRAACAGATAIAEYLGSSKCTTLFHLELCFNGIGLAGARSLAQGLSANSSLKSIDLLSNQLTANALLELGTQLHRSSCTQLGFLCCDAFSLRQGAASLELANFHLGLPTITLLTALLKRNTCIRKLNLSRRHSTSPYPLALLFRNASAFPARSLKLVTCSQLPGRGARSAAYCADGSVKPLSGVAST